MAYQLQAHSGALLAVVLTLPVAAAVHCPALKLTSHTKGILRGWTCVHGFANVEYLEIQCCSPACGWTKLWHKSGRKKAVGGCSYSNLEDLLGPYLYAAADRGARKDSKRRMQCKGHNSGVAWKFTATQRNGD